MRVKQLWKIYVLFLKTNYNFKNFKRVILLTLMRCRLVLARGGSTSQEFGCSPIKKARELGSERRETVRSISGMGVGVLRVTVL